MVNAFANNAADNDDPGRRHYAITPSDTEDLPRQPRAIYCKVAGDVVIRDAWGVDQTYTLAANSLFAFAGAVRILATDTTATLIGWE